MRRLLLLTALTVGLLAVCGPPLPPVRQPAGVLAAHEPTQLPFDSVAQLGVHRLHLVATFNVEARVLSRRRYHLGRESRLAPLDLALGWGPMSDSRFIGDLDIAQMGRWYTVGGPDLADLQVAMAHSTNAHMVPAAPHVRRQLLRLRRGQIVRLEGYLVDVSTDDGWRWRTSRSREDRGNGACELMLVTSVLVVS